MNRYGKSPDNTLTTSYIMIPVYSEQANDDGSHDIVGYRREYI